MISQWFISSARILPWREDPSPYRVWISEIMLQQTQVVTVVPYFEKFISRFPTVESLARAPLEDVLSHWSGLGYYSRARNIHAAAKLIVANGFPLDRMGWESLPGVGPYTAGAVLSIAYHEPEAIVDGNVERVLSRVHRLKSRDKNKVWKLSRAWVSEASRKKIDPSVLNQGLMELGARICKPKNPLCEECPIRSGCQAFKLGDVEKFPAKKIRAESVLVNEAKAAWVSKDLQVLITLDQDARWRKGLWDLPAATSTSKSDTTLKIKYVVTKHKVLRKINLKLLGQNPKKIKSGKNSVWIKLTDAVSLPHGASLRKSLVAISDAVLGSRLRD